MNYHPLNVLPIDIQNDFGAAVVSATPTKLGVYRLVAARRTRPKDFESQRITVRVVDEDGQSMEGVPVAFSYSTADQYTLTADFQWQPPSPHRAFLVRTGSAGAIDQIQGDVVKVGQPGGVTVYILTPEYSSDVVTGAGMLFDHTGLVLTYQLRRTNVIPAADRLAALEAWVTTFESQLVKNTEALAAVPDWVRNVEARLGAIESRSVEGVPQGEAKGSGLDTLEGK